MYGDRQYTSTYLCVAGSQTRGGGGLNINYFIIYVSQALRGVQPFVKSGSHAFF